MILETIDSVGHAHACYYRVASLLYKVLGQFAKYYTNSLKYLGCVDITTINGITITCMVAVFNSFQVIRSLLLRSISAWLHYLLTTSTTSESS